MTEDRTMPLQFQRLSIEEMRTRGESFFRLMAQRRSVRTFSSDPVPRDLIEIAIRTASSAPSGANCQPWHFTAVSDSRLKRRIRVAAEAEEKKNYEKRMPESWLKDLEPLGTGWKKPFLEEAPWLVAVFAESFRLEEGEKRKNYYVQESVGIACGLFIASLHSMGLMTLTHTPSPMGFLRELLDRPRNERAYILFPVGYPAEGTRVPRIDRKDLSEVSDWR